MQVELFFHNLDKTKQTELLKAAGVSSPNDMNWADIPVAIVELEPETTEI